MKRYYWLKLKENFFDQPEIKKLRKLAGGDSYVNLYLEIMLLSLKSGGKLIFEGLEDTFPEEIALKIDKNPQDVAVVLKFIEKYGLMEIGDSNEYLLLGVVTATGSDGTSTERVRRFRNEHSLRGQEIPRLPKTNAERQMQYRAKQSCEKQQHVPFIESYMNNKRYGGYYYVVIRRDNYRCAKCGSIENLCVHHIDGYDEGHPENNVPNKMITLCRTCHSQIHHAAEIGHELLMSIDYFNRNVTENETSLQRNVTKNETPLQRNVTKNETLEIEKDKERDIDNAAANKDINNNIYSADQTKPQAAAADEAEKQLLKKAFSLWENNLGTISGPLAEQIADLVKKTGWYAYEKAVRKAKGKAPHMGYVS